MGSTLKIVRGLLIAACPSMSGESLLRSGLGLLFLLSSLPRSGLDLFDQKIGFRPSAKFLVITRGVQAGARFRGELGLTTAAG